MAPRTDNNTVPMVDTSYWNTYDKDNLDLSKAAAAGVRVNMIRLGKGVPDLNNDHGVDRAVHDNIAQTVANGIEPFFYWRIYHCWHESGIMQATRAATWFHDIVSPNVASGAPFVIDVEEYTDSDGPFVDPQHFSDWILDFTNTLRANGIENLAVYTRGNFWDANLNKLHYGHIPLGVAHWVRKGGSMAPFSADDANTWDETAYKYKPEGPTLPLAWRTWAWWQCGVPNIGKALGFSSEAIDVNIMRADVFEHWFGKSA